MGPGSAAPESRYSPSVCEDKATWTDDSSRDPLPGFHYRARTSFTLPVSAEELSFIAEGANMFGSFDVTRDADADSQDAIVEVEVEGVSVIVNSGLALP